ncbi:MFS transporter [Asanoa ishikariensis]|uniref:Fucose permease n=1 Tax=Asanoa ishikariensis TaxID=137265 RepID=A0A1H3TN19_9ACTN|nr:MFS transporter [Asanoa ishikariensis]GIF62096.1 MFS transporter [Asanoa ishikariensis]SDZ51672.1 Fucose permease [Asanoa ishikariensis]
MSASTSTGAAIPREVLRARTAVAVVFGLNGLALSSWFARVPAARDALELSAGQLGLLLLTVSAGAVAALPVAGVLTHRLGTSRTVAAVTVVASAGLALAGVGAGVFGSPALVGIGLFALGYGSGTCEVAMNVQGAAVERRLRRTIMPRFHAAWSLGTVTGALFGAGCARMDVPIGVHLALASVVMAVGTLFAASAFLASTSDDGSAAARPRLLAAWRDPRVLLIGLFVLVLGFTEGAANDWLALAFVDGHEVSEAAGAAAFGVFVVAMTIGRTAGTVALDAWGRVPVLFATMLIAAAGTVIVVFAGTAAVALGGVALWGLGASLGFPVGMSAAADDEARAPARVSVVAVLGYTAFLAGPPLVGFLGDHVGILRALLVVPLVLLPALALLPSVREQRGLAA